MCAASRPPDWQLVFVLPNLALDKRDIPADGITLGLEGIAICSTADKRVAKIRAWSSPADRFLDAFHDGNGNNIQPSVLLAREDWVARFNRSPEPVIAFRNAVALSVVLDVGRDDAIALIAELRDPLIAAAEARPDGRPPAPHITVARPPRRATASQRRAAVAWAEAKPPIGASLTLDRLALYTWSDERQTRQFRRMEVRTL